MNSKIISTMYAFFLYSMMPVAACFAYEINQAAIDAGLIITQPGTWVLTESVVVQGASGITIQADDVIVDLQGNALRAAENADYGIVVTAQNCSILNGLLEDFNIAAILVDTVSGLHLSKISIAQSYDGVQLKNSSDVELQQIDCDGITDTALVITDCDYTTITACYIKNVGSAGVIIQGQSFGTSLEGVFFDTGQNKGLVINSDNVQLIRVSVQSCGSDGIVINGNNNSCDSVSSKDNGGSGFVINGKNTFLRNCMAGRNGGDGVTLGENSESVSILVGMYAANGQIGINNQGSSTNEISYAQVYGNLKRNLYRMVQTVAA
jgi:hypothetical protein